MIKSRILRILSLLSILTLLTGCEGFPSFLSPKGIVAFEERQLLFDATALMLIVVLTVIIMSIVFVYHYRASNDRAEYKPEWCHNTFLELLWWGIPLAIIVVLSVMTWTYTHKLDPYRRLNYPGKVMNVQVVALPWKWLFIYPEYNIATVNYLALPNKVQTEFHLTSDNVPMSSFIVPQLGSQIYTMAGMRTRLHLIPTHTGIIEGMNAQYNGHGFAEMRFNVNVMDKNDFDGWVKAMQKSTSKLDKSEYLKLRANSYNNSPAFYNNIENNLFMTILGSYNSDTHPVPFNGDNTYVE